MRKLWVRRAARTKRNDVADSGNSRHTRPKQIVDRDVAAIGIETEPFDPKSLRHWSAAGRDYYVERGIHVR